jgi:hypothetical protein
VDQQACGAGGGFAGTAPPVRGRRPARRTAAAVLVLLVAIAAAGIGFAVSGGGAAVDAGAAAASGDPAADVAARSAWRTASADTILPPKLAREGTEAYYRLAVDPDESCGQLPADFVKALGPAGCVRVVQATYVDSTESVVATVGLVVAGGTAGQRAALFQNWTADSYAKKYSLMPSAYPVKSTLAAGFRNAQRITWMSSISNDGTYIAYTVSGFLDGRTGPSAAALAQGTAPDLQPDSPPVQVADDLPAAVLDGLGAAAKNNADGRKS